MSITSWLLLFLLFLSLHACNARPLDKKLQNKYHSSTKNQEKKGFKEIPAVEPAKMRSSLSNQQEATKGEDIMEIEAQRITKEKIMSTPTKTQGEKTFDHHQNESLVSVSWRVPRDKNRPREKNPGFNLDYSPPKTHPPSHN